MVVLRHGSATSSGPRSYNEDLTAAEPDLSERLESIKSKEELDNLPSPSAYYGVSPFSRPHRPTHTHALFAPAIQRRTARIFRFRNATDESKKGERKS